MKVVRTAPALKRLLSSTPCKSRGIGFVPTMGFLHEGHISLVRRSVRDNDCTVVSIFVNPLQFGPKEDFSRYPRDLARDRRFLMAAGADIVWIPDARQFYPKDFQTSVRVLRLSQPLCGRSRPIHFEGVATVVLKLLLAVNPQRMYLGQKDFQQCRVIEQMVSDLGLDVRICRMPIVRESDGLALSSRNIFLSPEERKEAVFLGQALKLAQRLIFSGESSPAAVKNQICRLLSQLPHARIDYVEIVDARTLENMVKFPKPGTKVLVALAVYFSKTRLIDNAVIEVR